MNLFNNYLEAIKKQNTSSIVTIFGSSNCASEYKKNNWEEGLEKAKEDKKGALKNLNYRLKDEYGLTPTEIKKLKITHSNKIITQDSGADAIAIHYFNITSVDKNLILRLKSLKDEIDG